MSVADFIVPEQRDRVPEEVKQFVRQTDRYANHIVQLVEQMLDVSRISTGKLDFDLTEFDLADLLKDTLTQFDQTLNTADSEITLESVTSAWIQADRSRVEQSIANLLSNAIRFGAGKAISVRLDTQADFARLSILDRGIGIAPENQLRIFNRFERAAQANHISGLGLGLYLAKHIVEAHGGKITLNSEEGSGSCFVISLPLVRGRTTT